MSPDSSVSFEGYELARDKALECLNAQVAWSCEDLKSVEQLLGCSLNCRTLFGYNPVHLIKSTRAPPTNKETSVAFFLIGGP